VRAEVGRLDSPDRILSQMTKFLTLFLGDPSAQILNFYESFANECRTKRNQVLVRIVAGIPPRPTSV
jgi:hypothetical protein